jgi:predicted phage terminase large subunit-like protein
MGKMEILYGGAAGGGKTDWLLMEALRYAAVEGYSALLLRRTYPQLSQADGLVERSKEWLMASPAKWSEGKQTWTFPSNATLRFGHLQHEDDKYNYQGGAYQFVGFDELTQFSESQYLYLFSRVRRLEGSPLPVRIRSASNPGGVGHDWVRQRFIVETSPERIFVPARLDENPYLDRVRYEEALNHLHPYERAQLLRGDWDAKPPGSRFQRDWFNIVDTVPFDTHKIVRAWDLAATEPKAGENPDWTVGALMSLDKQGKVLIQDIKRYQIKPGDIDTLMLRCARQDPEGTVIHIEEEPGSAGKIASEHFRKLLKGYTAKFNKPTGPKPVRANPVASYAEGGLISILRAPWNEEMLREFEMFTGVKGEDAHDDQVDAVSLGFAKLCLKKGVSPRDLYGGDSAQLR